MSRAKNRRALTQDEEEFARLVANGMKQGEAFAKVFPERVAKMTNKGSMHVQATLLADKCTLRIKQIHDSMERAITRRYVIDAETWAQQTARMAFYDPRDLADPKTGKMRKLHELGDDIAAVIEGVEQNKTGVKYRLARKSHALEAIARRLQLFQEVPPVVEEAERREPVNTVLLARKLAVLLLRGAGDVVDIDPESK